MKIFLKNLVAIILFFSVAYGQYQIKCDYLLNPEKIKGYVDSCATFWLPTYDTVYGGFYSNVPRNGIVTDFDSKNMLTQTRTAYGMVRAFMLNGDTTYLKYARGALDFIYTHAWDEEHDGGWYNEMDRQGNLKSSGDHNDDKWSFMQHYALIGITAMVEATQNSLDWQFLLDGRLAVDNKLWDSRSDYLGYYETADVDWSNPDGKGFTPTFDGITTHILSIYLLTEDEGFKERLLTLADHAADYFLPAMSQFEYGFPESYNSNWQPNLNNVTVFTGHLLKAAWCATRAYLVEPKQEYLDFSTTMLEEVLEKGYDTLYGGCYKEFNGATGQQYDTNKEWWELEEMFNSGIMNYYLTSDERFLEMADETLEFYMKNFVDHVYGEVYSTTSRAGSATDNRKAHYWKAGYHSIEFGYYVYLYANLFLYNEPVTLYYYIQPADSDRELKLNPLAIQENQLLISAVQLNDQSYNNFLPGQRILNIPSGSGGIFKITFEKTSTGIAGDESDLPEAFKLQQNYPNPFNSQTKIEYKINESGYVSLEIFDITGRKIKTLVNDFINRGTHSVNWNGRNESGSEVSSGIYFYNLNFNNHTQSRMAVLLK